MPPKKQLKKLKHESESEEDIKVPKKILNSGKKVSYVSESGSSSESDSSKESSESDDSEDVVVEKYDEVDDEDILGDANNEVDDEDEAADGESEKGQSADEKEDDIEEVINDNDSDDCVYRFNKKKNGILEDDDGGGDVDYFFDDDVKIDEHIYVSNEDRITKPVLTKYERVRILGERARQLSLGAKPMVKGLINSEPKDVARLELQLKVVPLIIIRTLPTGKKERWRISELEIMN